jgi:hypothetical protein
MNYISCIIQILEIPKIKLSNNIPMVNFRVQVPYTRNKPQFSSIVESTIWGDLAYDVANYYRVNDYALIEGYVSPGNNSFESQSVIQITIFKLYPFLFTFEIEKEK